MSEALNDLQKRVLLANPVSRWPDGAITTDQLACTATTLYALERRGLVETSHEFWDEEGSVFPTHAVAIKRFTARGLALRAHLATDGGKTDV